MLHSYIKTMRSIIEINATSIKNNYSYIKNNTSKEIIAVIKSNGYGLGLILVAKILSSIGVNFFCVSTIEEAIELRKNGFMNNILLLEKSYDFETLSSLKITLSISSIKYYIDAKKSLYPLSMHIKIETGMNRLGLTYEEVKELINMHKDNKNQIITGLYTHIASESSYQSQINALKKIIDLFPKNINLTIHSNSSSYFDKSPFFTTHIRVGLALFGYGNNNLKEALSLLSPIYRIKKVKKGDKVGYGLNGIIPEDGYLYTIPLGYADGWKKERKTIGYKKSFLSQIGDTCMDYMMLFSKEEYKENEIIEIISPTLKLEQLAKIYNESTYEIISMLSMRIKRKIKSTNE